MIARAASWLWNEIAADQIDNAKAGKLTYLLNVQKGICQAIEEQKQLTELMSSGDILRITQFWQFYRYETDITRLFRLWITQ